MFKMTRAEKRGDRSRKRISLPREQTTPLFSAGMVTVVVQYAASVQRLKRLGFERVPRQAADAMVKPLVIDPAPALQDLELGTLRKLASDLKIKGRSKMGRDELISALE